MRLPLTQTQCIQQWICMRIWDYSVSCEDQRDAEFVRFASSKCSLNLKPARNFPADGAPSLPLMMFTDFFGSMLKRWDFSTAVPPPTWRGKKFKKRNPLQHSRITYQICPFQHSPCLNINKECGSSGWFCLFLWKMSMLLYVWDENVQFIILWSAQTNTNKAAEP